NETSVGDSSSIEIEFRKFPQIANILKAVVADQGIMSIEPLQMRHAFDASHAFVVETGVGEIEAPHLLESGECPPLNARLGKTHLLQMRQGSEVGDGRVFDGNFGLDRKREDKSFESGEACHQLEASCGHVHRKSMPGASAKIEFL